MNRTMTSPDSVVSPPLQRTQFFIALISPGSTHAAGDRAGISGDLTSFSATNGALRTVKGTQMGNESHDDVARQCGKSSVATNKVLHRAHLTWKHPRRWRSTWHFR
jgi:hypothetical protein